MLKSKVPGCRKCAYFEHEFVPSEGSLNAEVVFIGDSPWKTEVYKNRPLIGPAGDVYNALLEEYGFERREVFTTNVVHCKPDNLGEAYPPGVVETCTELFLKRELERIKPKLLVPMGNSALKGIGFKENITRARGLVKDHEFFGQTYKVIPTYHPSFILRKPAYLPYSSQDFEAIQYFLEHNTQKLVNTNLDYKAIRNAQELQQFLMEFEQAKFIAWDTETTGLDYRTDEILSMQFSFKHGQGYCLPFFDLPYEEHNGKRSIFSNITLATTLYNLLHNKNKVYFFHNGKFDLRMLYRFFLSNFDLALDIDRINWYDTQAMYGLLNENTFQGLKEVSKIHTDLRYTSEELGTVKGGQMKKATLEQMAAYGCLSYESRVFLSDGTTERIGILVNSRFDGFVQCHDGRNMTTGRVIGWHRNLSKGQKWYRILTHTTPKGRWGYLGAEYTPDHEIFTDRGKIRIEDIRIGKDRILTDESEFSEEQMSVFLGCMIGDGGLHSKNDVLSGFRFGQTFPRLEYAAWKSEVFRNYNPILQVNRYNRVGNIYHQYTIPYSRYLAFLHRILPIKSPEEHPGRKLRITRKVLQRLGVLGLAVWYQDDGSLSNEDTRISSTLVTEEEIFLVKNWLLGEFGIKVDYYKSVKQDGIFVFRDNHEKRFHDLILPYIHPDCFYKSIYQDHIFKPYLVGENGNSFYETITGVEEANPRPKTENVRYCLTIENHGNFLTQDGIVSNCKDTDACRRIGLKFAKELKQDNLWDIYCKHEASDMRIANILYKMELFGAPIDLTELKTLEHFMQIKLKYYHKRMERRVGKEFNPNSDSQLRTILFEDLKFPVPEKKTKGGKISTDKEVISGLMEQFPKNKFLQYFRMHRNYTSIEETFVRGFEKKLDIDGRLHPDFGFTRTVSGRIVCYKPNLANIPRDREFEEGVFVSIRSLFASQPGKKIVYADASQIEFKVAAVLSKDKKLIHALFIDRADFHDLVARGLYPKYEDTLRKLQDAKEKLQNKISTTHIREKYEDIIKSCEIILKVGRTRSKNFNFGRIYGAQPPTLAAALGTTVEKIEPFIARLAKRYPRFERFIEDMPKQAIREGELISPFNRRRRFPQTPDERVEAEQARQGGNFLPQSSAAYAIRGALVRIAETFEKIGMNTYPFNIVYDAIICEAPDDEVSDASLIVAQEMLRPVPELDNHSFSIEMGVGQSWHIAEKNAKKVYTVEDLKSLAVVE